MKSPESVASISSVTHRSTALTTSSSSSSFLVLNGIIILPLPPITIENMFLRLSLPPFCRRPVKTTCIFNPPPKIQLTLDLWCQCTSYFCNNSTNLLSNPLIVSILSTVTPSPWTRLNNFSVRSISRGRSQTTHYPSAWATPHTQ